MELKSPRLPGAYVLTHVKTGRIYIGSTSNLSLRKKQHEGTLRRGVHRNKSLQAMYDQDPELQFVWYLTETRDEAYDLEQYFLDFYKTNPLLCNVSLDARNPGKFTRETRDKIKQTVQLRGPIEVSEETRKKMSDSAKGKVISPETKEKMKLASSTARSVCIDGVVYPSVIEASRKMSVPFSTVKHRLNHQILFPSWQYIT